MRVTIWDYDWFSKTSFIPNYKAQKISSFHKQKGDLINFVEEPEQIKFESDLTYIIREVSMTPMIDSKYLDIKSVKLVGKEFKFYSNYFELDLTMEMVRPDYMLYNITKENTMTNVSYLQLLHGKEFLAARQDHINHTVKFGQRTMVVDDTLWDTSNNTLYKCLDEIAKYEQIYFKYPVSLKRILGDNIAREKFGKIKLVKFSILRFKNDYGSSLDESYQIIDFLSKLKQDFDIRSTMRFPIKSVLLNHWEDEKNGIKDLERVLKIVDYGKINQVQVLVKSPLERLTTPFWYYFDSLEWWTSAYSKSSYIESMVSNRVVNLNERWDVIINDPTKWSSPRTLLLIHLLIEYTDIMEKYGTRIWKDKVIDFSQIDIKSILKYKNYFEREEYKNKIKNLN